MSDYKGIFYEPASYDDVPEPTDADLAAIEAAWDETFWFNAPPDCGPEPGDVQAWSESLPVLAALHAAGEFVPGGREWLYTFTTHLFGFVDSTADMVPAEMVEALSAWNWHMSQMNPRQGNLVKKAPTDQRSATHIPRMLLTRPVRGKYMTFDNCAWLLELSTPQLEKFLWPHADLPALHLVAAALLDDHDLSIKDACVDSGVDRHTAGGFLKLRYPQIHRSKGSRRPALSTRAFNMSVDLLNHGWSLRDIYGTLVEAGHIPESYKFNSLWARLYRAGVPITKAQRAKPPCEPVGSQDAAA